jgi:hypothetical protein
MSTIRPFKITINDKGERVAVDLTDAEIADAQQRTAVEQAERAVRDLAVAREAALKSFLIQLAARQPDAPQILRDWAAELEQQNTATERRR